MTTFDATRGGDMPRYQQGPDTSTTPEVAQQVDTIDSLALLREAVAQQAEPEEVTIEVPRVGIRLVCTAQVTSGQMSAWQRRAMPPSKRKAVQPSPLDINQAAFNSSVLSETCARVEVQAPSGEWRVIEDANSGDYLTLKDSALLSQLGALDAESALRKIFAGRDGWLIQAGTRVLAAAGFGGDDDEDPTA